MATIVSTTSPASESQHWYAKDGRPVYEVVGKNGKTRAATLRDARELGLLPGFTTIANVARKPQLEAWLEDQAYQSAFTTPAIDGEPYDAWKRRCKEFASEEAVGKRDRGTEIHAAIEMHFRREMPAQSLLAWAMAADDVLLQHCGKQEWFPEKSYATITPEGYGYGSKLDLPSDEWYVDTKTKDGIEDKPKMWDEWAMQLAAGLRLINDLRIREQPYVPSGLSRITAKRAGILIVSRNEPEAAFIEATPEELDRGLRMFDSLLAHWYAKTQLVIK